MLTRAAAAHRGAFRPITTPKEESHDATHSVPSDAARGPALMSVPIGVGFAANVPAPRVVEAARLAEQLGYGAFWVTDSHLAQREAFALLGALAVSTSRLSLGTGVSHLAGRHPSVLASSFTTLGELAPGRVRLGIGVGDSGPLNLGLPRTSVADLEQAVVQ